MFWGHKWMCSDEKCHLDSSENWGVTVFPQAGHMQSKLQTQRHLLSKPKISLQGHKGYFFSVGICFHIALGFIYMDLKLCKAEELSSLAQHRQMICRFSTPLPQLVNLTTKPMAMD